MFIIVSRFLLPKGIAGLTLFPFIFLKYKHDKKNLRLINHEKIHIRQQLELLIIPFYVLYAIDFVIKYVKYKDSNIAYRNITFEKEAYEMDDNLLYLKSRRWYSFVNFL